MAHSQTPAITTSVVVVGGGVVGLAVTNALLRARVDVVSLSPPLSADRPAASRAAGAMLGAFGELTANGPAADAAFDFRLRAQRLYPEWLGELCDRSRTSVFQARGTFVVANNTDVRDRPAVRSMRDRADDLGEPAEYVEPEDVPGLKPSPHHVPGLCLHLPREHSVDAESAPRRIGGERCHLPSLDASARGSRRDSATRCGGLVDTSGGQTIATEHVVLGAGSRSFEPLSPELRTAAGLPELYFGKGVSCIVSGGPTIDATIRSSNRAFACGIHVVPRANGRLYLGATNQLGSDHDANQRIQPGELHNMFHEILHQLSTDVRESRIEELRTGYRPILAHGRPIIGATDLPGLSVATGTYRDGVLMAPLLGAIVAAGVLGDDDPENPFPVKFKGTATDRDSLVDEGIRDVIAFLHEPRGELPYDRAEELRKYVTTPFRMALEEDGGYSTLRAQIHAQLERAPLNETMHKVFRRIVEDPDQ